MGRQYIIRRTASYVDGSISISYYMGSSTLSRGTPYTSISYTSKQEDARHYETDFEARYEMHKINDGRSAYEIIEV